MSEVREDEDYPRPRCGIPLPIYRFDDPLWNPNRLDVATVFRDALERGSGFLVSAAGYGGVCALVSLVLIGSLTGVIGIPILFLPFHSGFSIAALTQLGGERWTFRSFFAGVNRVEISSVGLCNLLLFPLLLPLVAVPASVVALFNGGLSSAMVVLLLVVASVSTSSFVFLQVRLFTFAVPLVIDRDFGAIEALAGSWTLTHQHFWTLLRLNLLLWAINLAGVLCFVVGLLLTVPFTALVRNAAYLRLTGAQPLVSVEEGE